MRQAKMRLGEYLKTLPDKKLAVTIRRGSAAVHDFPEDKKEEFGDLVAIAIPVPSLGYLHDAFEFDMPEQADLKKKVCSIVSDADASVDVILVADDSDSDSFPTIQAA